MMMVSEGHSDTQTSADLPGVWFSLATSGQWNITLVAPGALSSGAPLHTGVLPNTTAPLTSSVWYTFRAISYGKVMAFKIDRTPAACFHSCGPSSFFVHFNATGAEQHSLALGTCVFLVFVISVLNRVRVSSGLTELISD